MQAKKHKMQKRIEYIILSFASLIGVYFLIINIIMPSYISVQVACHDKIERKQILNKYNAQICGQFSVVKNEQEIYSPQIEIHSNDLDTVIHELCHLKQYKKGKIKNCSQKFGRFFNEAECYFKEVLF